jgi:sulfur carrier protein
MNLTLNGRPATLPDPTTVADLLEEQRGDRRPHGIAVAVNDDVVPRGDWAAWQLRDGDQVEVVTAVQGG